MKIDKRGYLVKKKNDEEIYILKDELMVLPIKNYLFKDDNNKPFPVYRENEKYLIIPKFYGIAKFGLPKKIKYPKLKERNFNFKGELKDYQYNIVNDILPKILNQEGGTLSVGCGRGKTVMGIYLACQIKVKTLIIVHADFLMNQWKERIEMFSDASIGIIKQKKIDTDKDIIIGMLQSIAKEKYDKEIFKDIGFVIFDEAHRAPSKFFSKALPLITSKYQLALSATPKREDKMEKILYWYFGPIIYQEERGKDNRINVRCYNFESKDKKFKISLLPFGKGINISKTTNNLVLCDDRNQLIVKLINEIIEENPNRKILMLSDRIKHLEEIKKEINKYSIDFYIGKMKPKELDEASKCQIILGTYQMASEALDIPDLNCLIMGTSKKKVEQSIGRILRKNQDINPLIIDIIDNLGSYKNQGEKRINYYLKHDYQISHYQVIDNKIEIIDKKTTLNDDLFVD